MTDIQVKTIYGLMAAAVKLSDLVSDQPGHAVSIYDISRLHSSVSLLLIS